MDWFSFIGGVFAGVFLMGIAVLLDIHKPKGGG